MFGERAFWKGVVVTLVVTWGYHHFVKPLPGAKATG
jgi:hypothetical protein